MMDKHTPGPWVARQGKYGWQIHSAPRENGKPSHWIASIKCESCPAHEDANAHLIAAAPDLLAALEAMRDHPTIAAVCPSPLWAQMVNAILKARSETA